jgi:ABC-2 type transport system ATP-binding protein
MPIALVEQLSKTFRTPKGDEIHAAKQVSLSIEEGEIYSLLGPNGAGKTTIISMMCGLLEPSSGGAYINGISISREPIEAKRRIGIVPQEIALYPDLSARENLMFFGRMYGLSGERLRQRTRELLEFTELGDRADDALSTFSGGMKRRVNIAAGLIHEPRLLYMDEPTVGVDPQSRRRILDSIVDLKERTGVAILYTTHLMEEAQEISDRIGIIDSGSLIAEGTHRELVSQVRAFDRLELEFDVAAETESFTERLRGELSGIEHVSAAAADGEQRSVGIGIQNGQAALPRIISIAAEENLSVRSIKLSEPNLEDVFLSLTGRELRD